MFTNSHAPEPEAQKPSRPSPVPVDKTYMRSLLRRLLFGFLVAFVACLSLCAITTEINPEIHLQIPLGSDSLLIASWVRVAR